MYLGFGRLDRLAVDPASRGDNLGGNATVGQQGRQALCLFLQSFQGDGQHAQNGDILWAAPFIAAKCGLQGGESHFIYPHGPGQGVLFQPVHVFLFAQKDTCLGFSQQLIAGEGYNIHPRLQGSLGRGLTVDAKPLQIHKAAAAQILENRLTMAMGQRHQLGKRGGP